MVEPTLAPVFTIWLPPPLTHSNNSTSPRLSPFSPTGKHILNYDLLKLWSNLKKKASPCTLQLSSISSAYFRLYLREWPSARRPLMFLPWVTWCHRHPRRRSSRLVLRTRPPLRFLGLRSPHHILCTYKIDLLKFSLTNITSVPATFDSSLSL